MRLPSAEKAGSRSSAAFRVSRTGSPPFNRCIQMSRWPSLLRSEAYAIHSPSGDSAGSVLRWGPVVNRISGPADGAGVAAAGSARPEIFMRNHAASASATTPTARAADRHRGRTGRVTAAIGSPSRCTGATKRYPRRGRVSMKRGDWGESPSASRNRLTAAFRPCSKSTNVSSGQRRFRSASRVTSSPGCSSSTVSNCRGCCWRLSRAPDFLSSPERRSSSKTPNLINRRASAEGSSMARDPMDRSGNCSTRSGSCR